MGTTATDRTVSNITFLDITSRCVEQLTSLIDAVGVMQTVDTPIKST